MRRNHRAARRIRGRAVAGALGAAAAVAVLAASPAFAVTAFTIRGTDILSPGDNPEDLLPALFAGADVHQVDYPASVVGMDKGAAEAVDHLGAAMSGVTGPIVISGFSQGAIAVALEKQRLMALSPEERAAAGDITFVTIGDPTSPGGILHWLPGRVPIIGVGPVDVPETPYDTVIVNREYDGWADFPDRPLNLLADLNALAGIVYVHGHYDEADLDLTHVPEGNVTTDVNGLGGKTTHYLVPTDKLPLLQPLRDLGLDERIAARIERPLRALVNLGYSRNDAQAVKPAAPEPRPASEPAPEPRPAAKPVADDAPAKPVKAAAKPKPRHRAERDSIKATPGVRASHHSGKPRHGAASPQADAGGPASAPQGDGPSGEHEGTHDAA